MAKKPDPSAPKGRVKPGTPSKLLNGKVFGYHGKYVWKTTFDAQTKAREAAKKGSALVKRGTSAITNTTKAALAKAPKGKIIKINKGDSAVVKAAKRAYNAGSRTRSIVNKIYKAGQTTRKNVDAVYNAGKEARKVHDKVVKGGKEVVKGAYEGGKDTKRAVNRLKPGGKIVKSEGGAITKYAKKPTSIVKTKGSKITPYKNPRTGKLATRGKVTPTTPKKAPVSQRRTNAKLKIEQFKKGTTKDTAFNRKYKVRGSSTNPWKTNRKGVITNTSRTSSSTNVKPRVLLNKAKNVATNIGKKGVKFAKSPTGRGLAKNIGKGGALVERVTLPLALIDQTAGAIRTGGNIYNRLANKPLRKKGFGWFGHAEDYHAKNIDAKNKYLKEHGNLKGFYKSIADEKAAKRLAKKDAKTKYDKSKKGDQTLKTEKPPTRVNNPNRLTGGGNAGRSQDSGGTSGNNQKVTTKNNKKESNNNKVTINNKKSGDTRGKEAGAYAAGYTDGQKSKKKTKKLTMRDRMRAKNEAIHGKEAIKKVSEYNKKWQKAKREGKLKEFKKKNPAIRHWSIGRRS